MLPHPWLKPLHRRVGTATAVALWLAFEAYYEPGGMWFWGVLGASVYALWDFFLSGNYRNNSE